MAIKGDGAGVKFLRDHVGHAGTDCLIWPLSCDSHGYGSGGHNGKQYKAHRFMCELVHGAPPSPDYQASHSCGNGHKGCVNPQHLSWKTRRQNQLERRKHGTAHTNHWGKKGKLSAGEMATVASLKDKLSQPQIARAFNISLPTVRRIFNGKTKIAREALLRHSGT